MKPFVFWLTFLLFLTGCSDTSPEEEEELSPEPTTLEGVWQTQNEPVLFTFLPGNRFVLVQWDESGQYGGFERGTYKRDETGLYFTTIQNNDGDTLTCANEKGHNCIDTFIEISVSGDELLLGSENDGRLSFERVEFAEGTIEGAWEVQEQPVLFIFMPNNQFVFVQWQIDSHDGGFERGSYTQDDSGMYFTTTQNNDGDTLTCDKDKGDNCAETFVEVSLLGDTFSFGSEQDGQMSFTRNDFNAAPAFNLGFLVDDNLRKCVSELGAWSVADIVTLYCGNREISDISGIEQLTSLKVLNLRENQITDVTPLAGLTNLVDLRLRTNQISDISALGGLINLEFLQITDNQVSDLTPLSNLSKLNVLLLQLNQITDISPLFELSNLTYVNLGGNDTISCINLNESNEFLPDAEILKPENCVIPAIPIDFDVIVDASLKSCLEGMNVSTIDQVIELNCQGAGITDLSGIEQFIGLVGLGFNNNEISDLSPLMPLNRLMRFSAHDNNISDLTPLSNLSNLDSIWLMNNQIEDLSPLSNLERLSLIWINNNNVSSLAPLETNVALRWLDVSSNPISSLESIENISLLKSLSFENTNIDNLNVIENFADLENLNISNTLITDISLLKNNSTITVLEASGNSISDLSPIFTLLELTRLKLEYTPNLKINSLEPLTKLDELHLFGSEITDFSGIESLTSLSYLDLGNNLISDTSVLSTLTNLEYLSVYSNEISDLSFLENLINLKTLELSSNKISDLSPLVNLIALQELRLAINPITGVSSLLELIELKTLSLYGNNHLTCEEIDNLDAQLNLTNFIKPTQCIN